MNSHVVLLSIPGLRERDLSSMPNLSRLALGGGYASLAPSFPAVTCPVQANMMTGKLPREHGVVANGFYWRDQRRVEMWTSWNDCIERPQLWDILHNHDRSITSAVWFALHSRGCGADYLCTPAPIHHPDGSESLWCETRPEMIYTELQPKLGHFPLQHFWGPLAGIQSTAWIVASAVHTAAKYRPNFFYIYIPHLDYAAQKVDLWRLVKGSGLVPSIEGGEIDVVNEEPLKRELADFVDAVVARRAPRVTGEDGRRALALATQVSSKMGMSNAG